MHQDGGPVGGEGSCLRVEVRDLVGQLALDVEMAVVAVVLGPPLKGRRRDDNVLQSIDEGQAE